MTQSSAIQKRVFGQQRVSPPREQSEVWPEAKRLWIRKQEPQRELGKENDKVLRKKQIRVGQE